MVRSGMVRSGKVRIFMSNYETFIASTEWKAQRERVLARDNYTCRGCDDKEERLEAHHQVMNYGAIDKEPDERILTLCKSCHDAITNNRRLKRYATKEAIVITHVELYPKKEIKENKYEDIELQSYRNPYSSNAQRPVSRPDEQDCIGNKEDHKQKDED